MAGLHSNPVTYLKSEALTLKSGACPAKKTHKKQQQRDKVNSEVSLMIREGFLALTTSSSG